MNRPAMINILKRIEPEYRQGAIDVFKTLGLAKNVFVKTKMGSDRNPCIPNAIAVCLGGAIIRGSGGRFTEDDHFDILAYGPHSPVDWSNDPATTKEDVVALLQESLL